MSARGTVFGRVLCRMEMACKTEDSQTVKSLSCLVGLLLAGAAWLADGHGSGRLSLLQMGAHYPRGKARQSRTSLGIWRRPDKMMEEMVGG